VDDNHIKRLVLPTMAKDVQAVIIVNNCDLPYER
jgi:hypothetical protein